MGVEMKSTPLLLARPRWLVCVWQLCSHEVLSGRVTVAAGDLDEGNAGWLAGWLDGHRSLQCAIMSGGQSSKEQELFVPRNNFRPMSRNAAQVQNQSASVSCVHPRSLCSRMELRPCRYSDVPCVWRSHVLFGPSVGSLSKWAGTMPALPSFPLHNEAHAIYQNVGYDNSQSFADAHSSAWDLCGRICFGGERSGGSSKVHFGSVSHLCIRMCVHIIRALSS